jgi:hypothetical protein
MPESSPLPGVVQWRCGDLLEHAQVFALAVDFDGKRYTAELKTRLQALYKLRPDLASYRYRRFLFSRATEVVFHEDGTIPRPTEDDWGFAMIRRREALAVVCNMPRSNPAREECNTVGERWVERLKGLNPGATVFVNADDSGMLTRGYTPFPEFDEKAATAWKGQID